MEERVDKPGFTEIKDFCSVKGHVKRTRDESQMGENICRRQT